MSQLAESGPAAAPVTLPERSDTILSAMLYARRVATLAWVVSVALCIGGAVFAAWSRDLAAALACLLGAAVPTTGAVVARHVPRNPVGWSQLAGGLLGATGTFGLEYGPVALAHGWPDGLTHLLIWIDNWAWVPGLASALVFTALWFPDGRVVTRAFRPVLALAIGATVTWCVTMGAALWRFPAEQLVTDTAPPPTGTGHVLFVVGASAAAVLLVVAVVAAGGLVVRWRRAGAAGRAQLKWVGAGLAAPVLFLVAGNLVDLEAWQNVLGTFSLDAVAVAIGVAVLRYRLYEIDRIVSRTVAYALVLVVLAGLYIGVFAGLAALIPADYGQLGVAAATLTVSIVAVPLTRRVRHGVDRRFNRRRYDAEVLVARFAESLRREVAPDAAGAGLVETACRALEPAHASVWLLRR